MRCDPLGDQAVMTSWGDEAQAFAFAEGVRAAPPSWLIDVVQAYRTVAVFYDPTVDFETAAEQLRQAAGRGQGAPAGKLHRIACCYEMGLDLRPVADHTGLSVDEVIRLHAETRYTVFAIGFCPGFPYLGYLPDRLAGVPRLPSPRLRVEAGSVGLTGRQTGIYTEPRPGGWNLVGRTPVRLVDVAAGYFPLRTGDQVQFERIDEAEYRRREGRRLDG